MKILIAVVMFLLGTFIGILVMPMFKEFSQPFSYEEEYSMPRVRTILHAFGVTLPPEASDINLYLKQENGRKQVWVRCECPSEARDVFIEQLTVDHQGRFPHEIELPKMLDGTPVSWWTNRDSYRYNEFRDLCVTYDDLLHYLYIYTVTDIDGESPAPALEELAE